MQTLNFKLSSCTHLFCTTFIFWFCFDSCFLLWNISLSASSTGSRYIMSIEYLSFAFIYVIVPSLAGNNFSTLNFVFYSSWSFFVGLRFGGEIKWTGVSKPSKFVFPCDTMGLCDILFIKLYGLNILGSFYFFINVKFYYAVGY